MVPVAIQPDNGVHRIGEAISVTFTTEVWESISKLSLLTRKQVNCDSPLWFDVSIVLNGIRSLSFGSEFTIVCQEKSLYLTINGEQVRSTHGS
jgi:hypothetical protein